MPWIRCAFGNVFFGNSNLAVLSLDLQTVWFTWSYCYQQSNHFWKISSISLLLSFGWSWWTCEKGKIRENCHYPPRVPDLSRLHRLDCIRARSALGSFPFLKYFIKISLLIVPISEIFHQIFLLIDPIPEIIYQNILFIVLISDLFHQIFLLIVPIYEIFY